jgi:hypothetical protein
MRALMEIEPNATTIEDVDGGDTTEGLSNQPINDDDD